MHFWLLFWHFVSLCVAAVKTAALVAAVIVHCRGDSWICDQSEWYWQHQSASPSYQHTRAKTNNRTTSKYYTKYCTKYYVVLQ